MEPIEKTKVASIHPLGDIERTDDSVESPFTTGQKFWSSHATRVEHRNVTILEVELNKAPESKACRRYLFSNLDEILDARRVLPDSLQTEIVKTKYPNDSKKIQTYVCETEEEVTDLLKSLTIDDCVLIIYKSSGESTELLTLSLITRRDESYIPRQVESIIKSLVFSEMDFFVITFQLDFDANGKLKSIDLNRGVSPMYQKKGICTEISRKVLEVIHSHIGNSETKVYCDSACHIGTVKFFYPLNCFYYKGSKKSARNFFPGSEYMNASDFEKGAHCLDGLSYNPPCVTASCPDGWVNLKKLLLQYKMKDLLESR